MKFLKEETAEELFGYTYYKTKAFYLTPEGRYLDGSDGQNRRVLDHRDIEDADDAEDMVDFMEKGNIRLSPEIPGIDLIKQPTVKQLNILKEYIDYFLFKSSDFYVDISNNKGYAVKSFKYHLDDGRITSADVLIDIIKYFKK